MVVNWVEQRAGEKAALMARKMVDWRELRMAVHWGDRWAAVMEWRRVESTDCLWVVGTAVWKVASMAVQKENDWVVRRANCLAEQTEVETAVHWAWHWAELWERLLVDTKDEHWAVLMGERMDASMVDCWVGARAAHWAGKWGIPRAVQ